MFWLAMLLSALGLSLVKLGALSVWVQVLGLLLKLAMLVILGGIAWAVIARLRQR